MGRAIFNVGVRAIFNVGVLIKRGKSRGLICLTDLIGTMTAISPSSWRNKPCVNIENHRTISVTEAPASKRGIDISIHNITSLIAKVALILFRYSMPSLSLFHFPWI